MTRSGKDEENVHLQDQTRSQICKQTRELSMNGTYESLLDVLDNDRQQVRAAVWE